MSACDLTFAVSLTAFGRFRGVLFALLWALLTVTVAPAYAADADSAFNVGLKHMAAGDYDAACAAFEKSEVPEPTMASRYQLGRCNEERGWHASARQAYLDAADLAEKKGDAKRASVARQRATELEAKVSLLLIVVGAEQLVEGLNVQHNGESVPAEAWNTPIKVDPGQHTVRFAAPGRKPVLLNLKAAGAGKVTRAVLPTLNATGASGAPGPPDTASGGGPTAVFWVGLGLTAVGAIVATAAAVDVAETDDCGDFCLGLLEEDESLAITGLILGGAMLAVGIPLMVVGWASDDGAPANAGSVEALLGPTSAGLRVRF